VCCAGSLDVPAISLASGGVQDDPDGLHSPPAGQRLHQTQSRARPRGRTSPTDGGQGGGRLSPQATRTRSSTRLSIRSGPAPAVTSAATSPAFATGRGKLAVQRRLGDKRASLVRRRRSWPQAQAPPTQSRQQLMELAACGISGDVDQQALARHGGIQPRAQPRSRGVDHHDRARPLRQILAHRPEPPGEHGRPLRGHARQVTRHDAGLVCQHVHQLTDHVRGPSVFATHADHVPGQNGARVVM
jgi:hypothetical protein